MYTNNNCNEYNQKHFKPPFLKSTVLFLLLLLILPHTNKHQYKADKEHRQAKRPAVIRIAP
jgi:hypothetical protein